VVSNVDLQLPAPPLQRLSQSDLHARVRHDVIDLRSAARRFDFHRLKHDPVAELSPAPAARRIRPRVLPIGVLLQIHPQTGQRRGTVVGVCDRLRGAELLSRRIEVGVDLVVRAVLPVIRPRRAVSGAVAVDGIRQRQRRKSFRRIVTLSYCLGANCLAAEDDRGQQREPANQSKIPVHVWPRVPVDFSKGASGQPGVGGEFRLCAR
jgi:hypothetical protein